MLPIHKKLGEETLRLIQDYWNNRYKYYENESKLEDYDHDDDLMAVLLSNEPDFPLMLFRLGYDIRRRIELLTQIAYAESIDDKDLIKRSYDEYRYYLNGSKETIKQLIEQYYKLNSVYDFGRKIRSRERSTTARQV